jgi:hypothetical protein
MKRIFAAFALLPLLAISAVAQSLSFDPTDFRRYWEEFDRYAAGEWTINTTEAGAGSGTTALTSVDGGAILITNDNADDDNSRFQLPSEGFKWESGKRLYFETRFKISDATQSDFAIGLQITDTTPLDVTDGIFFIKADGAATVDLRVEKNDTATTSSAIATMVSDTFITLAFYYEPSDGKIQYFVNGAKVGASVITNVVDDEELAVSFALQNGEAVAKTMTLDYIFVAKQRD